MEPKSEQYENGWSHKCSQRSVEEQLQESTIGDGDAHLVEFSVAMRSMCSYSLCPCGRIYRIEYYEKQSPDCLIGALLRIKKNC